MDKSNLIKSFLLAAAAGGIALSSASAQQLLVSEDWEAGNADNWTDFNGTKGSFLAGSGPSSASGDDTHVFYNPGTTAFVADNTVKWSGSVLSVEPSNANPVVLRGDLFYSGSTNQRNSLGFRTGANPLFEVGFNNSAGSNGLAVRVLDFAGNEGWMEAVSYTALGTTGRWISSTSTFTGDGLTVELVDTLAAIDGGFGTVTITSIGSNAGEIFTDLRFGGISNLSSAGGGAGYDNISLEVIPEPSTYAAIFGGLALVGAFVYRRRLSVKK